MDLYDDVHTDSQWVEQALEGDPNSFNRLLQKYQTAVLALTYHWTHDPAEAQDIAQETFLQAYKSLGQLKDPGKFAAWLRSIATNRCRMWHRNQHNRSKSLDSPANRQMLLGIAHPGRLPSEILEDREKLEAIDGVLNRLSDALRLTARLFYISGFSYREISSFLDVPITTVESRLHKARIQLKKPALRKPLESILGVKLQQLEKEIDHMDPILITIGGDLISSCANPEGPKHDLLGQIEEVRKALAAEHRIKMPPVRVMDDNQFPLRAYQISFFDKAVEDGDLGVEETIQVISTQLGERVRAHRDKFSS